MRWRKEYGRRDQGEGDQGEGDGAYDKSSFEIKGTGIRVTDILDPIKKKGVVMGSEWGSG